jgi:hypothetical protein
MLIAEAHVETERASQYLGQLCRHFKHRAQQHPDMQANIEWSETHGVANFGWGRCTMQATGSTLTLRAEAADNDSLQHVEDLVAEHLQMFAKREDLDVRWAPG